MRSTISNNCRTESSDTSLLRSGQARRRKCAAALRHGRKAALILSRSHDCVATIARSCSVPSVAATRPCSSCCIAFSTRSGSSASPISARANFGTSRRLVVAVRNSPKGLAHFFISRQPQCERTLRGHRSPKPLHEPRGCQRLRGQCPPHLTPRPTRLRRHWSGRRCRHRGISGPAHR